MPYLHPAASPTALVPFPAKADPPALVRASVTASSATRQNSVDLQDSNSASVPLKVPRSRPRGRSPGVAFMALSSEPSLPDRAVLLAAPAHSKHGGLRVKRHRGHAPALSLQVTTNVPFSDEPAPIARTAPASTVKHEPINSGPGGRLRLTLDAMKRTVSESHLENPPVPYNPRFSAPNLPSLVRKKSGEVLKSSLKPYLAGPNALHVPSPGKPEFETPESPASPTPTPSPRPARKHCKSAPTTPTGTISKNVHFDAQLEYVKLFLSEQKPAAVSRDGSPTEDSDTSGTERGRRTFVLPPLSPSSEDDRFRASLVLRIVNASPTVQDALPAGVHVQVQSFALTPDRRDVEVGVLVRNLAFSKMVAVRFTLDNWQTTSEVTARHVMSVWSPAGGRDPDMDRFTCTVRLGDFGGRIKSKTMLAAVRYELPGVGQVHWDNNGGANYQIVFERLEEPPEPPSPSPASTPVGDQMGTLRRELEKVVRHDDRAQSPIGDAAGPSSRPPRWQLPHQHGTVPFPSTSRHRQWYSETTPPRSSFKRMARGSPRDTDEAADYARIAGSRPRDTEEADYARLASRRGADSPRLRLRKKPSSYFEIPVEPARLSWGYSMDHANTSSPNTSERERRSSPIFDLGGADVDLSTSGSSDDSSASTSTEHAPTRTDDLNSSDDDDETDRAATPIPTSLDPAPALLEDRSRTSSSSSVSSTGSWEGHLGPTDMLYDPGALLSPLSILSTPASSSATSTSASSPLDSPSDGSDFLTSPLVHLDAFFAAKTKSASSRPSVEASNYTYFLDRFCFYTGKDGDLRDAAAVAAAAAPMPMPAARLVSMNPSLADDYFGTAMSGSPPPAFAAAAKYSEPGMAESADSRHAAQFALPHDLIPTIHATLAAAVATTSPGASGRSTPTTPRAETPTPALTLTPA